MNLPNLKKQSEVEIIKLAPQSLITKIYNKLKKSLINGDLKPGEKLKIDSLKDKYNSGHTPIREALTSLVKDGLVERIEQKGFVASNVSMKHFNEVLKTRIWIEEIAIKKSMENKKGLEEWEENLLFKEKKLKEKSFIDKAMYKNKLERLKTQNKWLIEKLQKYNVKISSLKHNMNDILKKKLVEKKLY